MELKSCIGLSTAHITENDAQLLEEIAESSNMVFDTDYGFIIKVSWCDDESLTKEILKESSDYLLAIIDYCIEYGYTLLELDRDIDTSDIFKSFNW